MVLLELSVILIIHCASSHLQRDLVTCLTRQLVCRSCGQWRYSQAVPAVACRTRHAHTHLPHYGTAPRADRDNEGSRKGYPPSQTGLQSRRPALPSCSRLGKYDYVTRCPKVHADTLRPGVHLAGQTGAFVQDASMIGCCEFQESPFADRLRMIFPHDIPHETNALVRFHSELNPTDEHLTY